MGCISTQHVVPISRLTVLQARQKSVTNVYCSHNEVFQGTLPRTWSGLNEQGRETNLGVCEDSGLGLG